MLVLGIADRLGDVSSIPDALGGGTALASHLVMAGSRLAINASPNRCPTSSRA